MTTIAVRVKGVTKQFSDRIVLHALSLDVMKGSIVGILGPSGCGKTTLLRLIAGLEVPDDGEIFLGEQLASSAGTAHISPARRKIGFVFQDLALWPHMTVRGNLDFVLQSRRWPREGRKSRVDDMLAMVGLKDRGREYPTHLSGGEQQRVALARALVDNPELLLLDEPLSSLDAERRAALRRELALIPRTLGVTMIYVTHELADTQAFGGETVVLEPSSEGRQG